MQREGWVLVDEALASCKRMTRVPPDVQAIEVTDICAVCYLKSSPQVTAFIDAFTPPGHVFICNQDLANAWADAMLIPCFVDDSGASAGIVFDAFRKKVESIDPDLAKRLCGGNLKYGEAITASSHPGMAFLRNFDDHVWATFEEERALPGFPILGNSVMGTSRLSQDEHVDALVLTVTRFVDLAMGQLEKHSPRPRARRCRHLLAVPVLGTRGGGASDLAGQIIERLLRTLSALAMSTPVDFVICCADDNNASMAQHIRQNLVEVSQQVKLRSPSPSFDLLPDHQQGQAREFGRMSAEGILTFFVGEFVFELVSADFS
jgi:hypothetical protein